MKFLDGYEEFIDMHRRMRSGTRLKRLSEGLGHAELTFLQNVWWPIFHHFENLHPEYEIRDYKEGYRYIDFAYIRPNFRIGIEIDGLDSHWRNISKWQFSDHWQRQNSLVIDGWYVLRFTFPDVAEYPRTCQQTIQQLLGNWQTNAVATKQLSVAQREIVRLAFRSSHPIKPKDASDLLDISTKHVQSLLHVLVEDRWLQPASGNVRITSYILHPSRKNIRW